MSPEVPDYYDAHAHDRLRDFVSGNPRIEHAWRGALARWSDAAPRRILEIGCGIGGVCFRLARRWPTAEVVGVDISPRSIALAQRLFGDERVRFVAGTLPPEGRYDLVMMMDVYEHIPRDDRAALHAALRAALSERGRLFLAFPTPRHLAWLRRNVPEQIQPVDEDIDLPVLEACARETGTRVLHYREVSVWNVGDYAHAELAREDGWDLTPRPRWHRRLRVRLARWHAERLPGTRWRRALVRRRLGVDPSAAPP
jgi:SAM-dependent methyltransferase